MATLQALLRAILLRRTKHSNIHGRPILQLPQKETREDRVPFDKDQGEFYFALERSAQVQMNRCEFAQLPTRLNISWLGSEVSVCKLADRIRRSPAGHSWKPLRQCSSLATPSATGVLPPLPGYCKQRLRSAARRRVEHRCSYAKRRAARHQGCRTPKATRRLRVSDLL